MPEQHVQSSPDDLLSADVLAMLTAFRSAGATSWKHAKTPSELELTTDAPFLRLLSADVVRRRGANRYYINEVVAAAADRYERASKRYSAPDGSPPELVALSYRLRALIARMRRRPSRAHHEVIEQLDGAWHTAVGEVRALAAGERCSLPVATSTLNEGVGRLTRLEQSRNRLHYLLGLLGGMLVVVAIPALVIDAVASASARDGWLAPWHWTFGTPGLPAQVVLFAGAGAVASVVTRLPSIDLSGETKNRVLAWSGASRPVVAVLFAAVVYQIIAHEIVTIGAFDQDKQRDALVKVAAFLCGFSERFATDILARVPFAAPSDRRVTTTGAPPTTSPT